MFLFKTLKEYIPIAYINDPYKAILNFNEKKIDITNTENILSINPLIFGFYANNVDFPLESKVILKYYKNKIQLTSISLLLLEKVALSNKTKLLLFKVTDSKSRPFYKLKMKIYNIILYLKKRGKTELDFKHYEHLISLYSIPRQIFICSFISKENEGSLFPIDLVIDQSNEGIMAYSIRKSNINVQKITSKKKTTLIYSSINNKNEILKLGKYHSKTFPEMSQLGFTTKRSKIHNHHIPSFLENYLEIENIIEYDIGEQILFIGKVIHQQKSNKNRAPLAYIHSFFCN